MELRRIELPSKLGSHLPFVHRFSLSHPQGGNQHFSLLVGYSGKFFASKSSSDREPDIALSGSDR